MKKISFLLLLCSLLTAGARANPYRLEGSVWRDNYIQIPQAMIYVIAITAIDPLTNDTTIQAIDSFHTDVYGGFGRDYASFPTPYPESIRLKAALLPNDAWYGSYLPTYYNDSFHFMNSRDLDGYGATLNWREAKSLDSSETHNSFLIIRMISGSNPGGPGFIGGSVQQGANKGTGVGDPLARRMIMLTRPNGDAVAYTYSDAAGKFSFPAVPLGEYRISGDVLGKSNPPLLLSLTAAKPSVSTIVFEESSKAFAGHIGSLGAQSSTGLSAIRIAPNPVGEMLRVQGLSAVSGEKTLLLLDATGRTLRSLTTTENEARLEMATLPAGAYLLQVQSSSGSRSIPLTK